MEGGRFAGLGMYEFREEHIPEYTEYAYESYADNNPEYREGKITKQQFIQECQVILSEFIRTARETNLANKTNVMFNHFLRIDGKMVLAGFTAEIHCYFKVMAKRTRPLSEIQYIPVELALKVPENKGIHMQRLAIRKQYFGTGLFQYYQVQQFKMFKKEGFETAAVILVNPRSLSHYTKMKKGLELTKIKGELQGKPVIINYVTINIEAYLNQFVPKSSL